MKIRLARASGATFGVDDISCAVATQLGLFSAQGRDVKWSDRRGGVAAMRAVLDDAELHLLWQREHDSGGWAVNGEMGRVHWDAQLDLFHELNPDLRKIKPQEILSPGFVAAALAQLGKHSAAFDKGETA